MFTLYYKIMPTLYIKGLPLARVVLTINSNGVELWHQWCGALTHQERLLFTFYFYFFSDIKDSLPYEEYIYR